MSTSPSRDASRNPSVNRRAWANGASANSRVMQRRQFSENVQLLLLLDRFGPVVCVCQDVGVDGGLSGFAWMNAHRGLPAANSSLRKQILPMSPASQAFQSLVLRGLDVDLLADHGRHTSHLQDISSCVFEVQTLFARSNTSRSIFSVNRPVEVFCWLGW